MTKKVYSNEEKIAYYTAKIERIKKNVERDQVITSIIEELEELKERIQALEVKKSTR